MVVDKKRLFKNDEYADNHGISDIMAKHLTEMYAEIDELKLNLHERDLFNLLIAEGHDCLLDRLLGLN